VDSTLSPIHVITTSIEELRDKGWQNFGVDVCNWESDSSLTLDTSTVYCCDAASSTLQQYLTRML
jgi:hypothetical protein